VTHAIHDFSAKLRQPSVAPTLESYVQWQKARRRAQDEGEPAPVSINLDLTVACNYRCTHCIDWDILNTKHRLAEDELRASISLMAERGLKSVILIGGGEPTLYPGFSGFVGFLKELGMQVAVVSNGSRGDRLYEIAPLLDERDWIRLSLDSGSNELFEAMHKPTNGKVTLDSICQWIPEIKNANSKPKIGFSYIIVWQGASREDNDLHENIHEIVMAADRAREHRFDYISFKPVLERQDDGAEVMDPSKTATETAAVVRRIREEVDKAKELSNDEFDVYESTNLRMLEQGTWKEYTQQPRTCHMQALRQVLSPLGLYNCPAHRGVEKAMIGGKGAWADQDRARATGESLRGILDGFDASHECREVTCLYNKVNWWIEEMIEDRRPETDGGTAGAAVSLGAENGDYFL
jgi:wyosine [tRNA(Phe)-imidazoG37] synthetase (radical SAM superfamily)